GRKVRVAPAIAVARHDLGCRGSRNNFRFLLVKRRVAPAAKMISCSELNKQAMMATDDFPRIYRGKSGGHRLVSVARAAAIRSSQMFTASQRQPTPGRVAIGCNEQP